MQCSACQGKQFPFTSNSLLMVLGITCVIMRLVASKKWLNLVNHKNQNPNTTTSWLKSALNLALIPIVLLSSSALSGLTFLPVLRNVGYASKAQIQIQEKTINWYYKALEINQNKVPALVQRARIL